MISLHSYLDENPGDREARLVLSDWYEENDDIVIAKGLRWMVKMNKRPFLTEKGWCWCYRKLNSCYSIEYSLWVKLLRAKLCLSDKGQKYYDTRREAEEDLCLALRRDLTPLF